LIDLTVAQLNPDDAFVRLGLTGQPTEAEVRRAFRVKVIEVHPDRSGNISNDETIDLLEAYRIALDHASADEATPEVDPAEPSEGAAPLVWLVDRDTIALACSHEEAFVRVLDVGHSLGAITYLDRQGELIEVLLRTNLGDTMSLVISFQGRNNWVEAFLTTEVLDRAKHELPSIEDLTELVAHRLITNW
jgi:hypothetical protein